MPLTLIIVAHPDSRSFGAALAEAYAATAEEAGCKVETLHLGAMEFDPAPRGRPGPLEAALTDARESIRLAHHLVLVYPTWLGAMPARMKGFFERVFADGFATQFDPGARLPRRMLLGRSADVLVTMDTPPLLYRLLLGAPGHKLVRRAILAPAGIAPVKLFTFGPLRNSTDQRRQDWLAKVRRIAARRCRHLIAAAEQP